MPQANELKFCVKFGGVMQFDAVQVFLDRVENRAVWVILVNTYLFNTTMYDEVCKHFYEIRNARYTQDIFQ